MSPEVIGWVASAVFLCRLLPQPLRLARTGVPDGVSAMAALNSAISDLAWVIYGLAAGLVPAWSVALVALGPGLWTVALLRRATTRRDLVVAGLWLGLIVVSAVTGNLTVLLGVSVFVNQGPQVWAAVRSDDLRGIAPMTWYIACADASLWGAYGVARGDLALMLYGGVLLTFSLIILGRVHLTRRASGLEPAPAPAV